MQLKVYTLLAYATKETMLIWRLPVVMIAWAHCESHHLAVHVDDET